ncbi:unnamed protein product [Chrysoparadoxa australica]
MDLSTLLANCQSVDQNVRAQAEEQLGQAAQQNLGQLLLALVNELGNDSQQELIRQQAGLYVKVMLSAADDGIRLQKIEQWKAVDPVTNAQIKAATLNALHSRNSQSAMHTAALILGKMGSIELPDNKWPEMLQTLLSNVTGQYPDGTKVASLEALGYMCEEWEPDEMNQDQTNQILTCIVDGIRSDRPDPIRLAAITALLNSLDFTQNNFEEAKERDFIMNVVCEATQCTTSSDVRERAFECVCSIADMHYDKLKDYMMVLWQLTLGAIQKEEEKVALQAVQFWVTLCEVEQDLNDEAEYARETGQAPERQSLNYVQSAVESLVPLLLVSLCKQKEEDDDDHGIAESSAVCLQSITETVGDQIVPCVVPFVEKNITSENWRQKEAAIVAFSSVLDGPSPEGLAQLVKGAVPVLLQSMHDPHEMVKDSATWTIGEILRLHSQSVPPEMLPSLLESLVRALDDPSASVCEQACFALHNFGEAFKGASEQQTNILSPIFSQVVQKLLGVIQRHNWDEVNLRVHAMEALNNLVDASAKDMMEVVVETLKVVVHLLEQSFNTQVLSADDREQQQNLQSLLCGSIHTLTRKLEKGVAQFGDRIMAVLLQVLKCQHATAQEEAFLCIGALADQLEGQFAKYMGAVNEVLLAALQNHAEYQICCIAVGVVGDLCRNLEDGVMAQYAYNIMAGLLTNLEDNRVNRMVKPPVLSCLGDMALAVGGDFEQYLQSTMKVLLSAQQVCVITDQHDEDMIEFINDVRESILEAYTGILQGLSPANKSHLLMNYAEGIMRFLVMLAQDQTKDDTVLRNALGVVGDMASTIGGQVCQQLLKSNAGIHELIQSGSRSDKPATRQMADWAREQVTAL